MINLDFDVDFEPDFKPDEIAELVVDKVLTGEGFPEDIKVQVDILITDNEGIRKINKEYRDIDKPTDVLSFPNVEWDSPASYDSEGFLDELLVDPETGEFMLGQIVLSKERIITQAEEFGHGIKREYSFLIAHSVLHLLGYDHMTEEEAKVMEDKQRTYLDELGIGR